MPHYAKQKIQTEISQQQNVAAQKYKRTCITVLNTLSHYATKLFVLWALYEMKLLTYGNKFS